VHSLAAHEISPTAANTAQQRWIPLDEASTMALTGLARKVLSRAGLIKARARGTSAEFASSRIGELI
jgi:hypothetical protein